MNRRTVLRSLGVGAAAVAGAAVVENTWSGNGTARANERVVYRDPDMQLLLTARQESVRLGDTIDFEVFNGGIEDAALGCNNPWGIERLVDGDWQTVIGRVSKWRPLCLTLLGPGETVVERVTMTEQALEAPSHTGELQSALRPGLHRFVLLGTVPHLAVDFQVLPEA